MKRVRFDTSVLGGNVYNCKGWYKHGCDKLIERKSQLGTIFPNKSYISSLDVIEHIVYGDPSICEAIQTIFNDFIKDLRTVESMILSGKWDGFVAIPAFNSYVISDLYRKMHMIREVETLIMGIKENFYITYLKTLDSQYHNLVPQAPNITYPRKSVKVDDTEGFTDMIKSILPYLLALELYHMDLARLLQCITIDLRKIIANGFSI